MAWVNIFDQKYDRPGIWLHFFVGGRGKGKTYGGLKGALEDAQKGYGHGFILLRRSDKERKLNEAFNPFVKFNRKSGYNAVTAPLTKDATGIYNGVPGEDGELVPSGPPLGYMFALSTLATMRSLGLDDDAVDKGLFDEFIPESHVRLIKNEGAAFLNAVETFNRNREFDGRPPIKWYLTANANTMDTPIFQELGLIPIIEKMYRKGQHDYYDPARGFAIHLLEDAEFDEQKKKTALARLTEGSDFYEMAYENKFAYNDMTCIRRLDAAGFTPCFAVGDWHVWQRKGCTEFYASYKDGSFAYRYTPGNQADGMLARQRHGILFRKAYAAGKITFESYEIKSGLLDFFGLK